MRTHLDRGEVGELLRALLRLRRPRRRRRRRTRARRRARRRARLHARRRAHRLCRALSVECAALDESLEAGSPLLAPDVRTRLLGGRVS